MTTRSRIREGDGDPRHGSVNGYSNLKCTCPACRAAWATYCREIKRARQLGPGDKRHGSENGYTNYECRCRKCRTAHSAYRRAYVRKRAA